MWGVRLVNLGIVLVVWQVWEPAWVEQVGQIGQMEEMGEGGTVGGCQVEKILQIRWCGRVE